MRATLGCTFVECQRALELHSSDVVKTRVVKRHDTLQSIAAEEYNDPSRWRDIARANRIVNPRAIPPGTVLTIPKLPLMSAPFPSGPPDFDLRINGAAIPAAGRGRHPVAERRRGRRRARHGDPGALQLGSGAAGGVVVGRQAVRGRQRAGALTSDRSTSSSKVMIARDHRPRGEVRGRELADARRPRLRLPPPAHPGPAHAHVRQDEGQRDREPGRPGGGTAGRRPPTRR